MRVRPANSRQDWAVQSGFQLGEGRSRDQIIRHVYGTEPQQFSRKVEVPNAAPRRPHPDGLATHRQEYLDTIRAYNAEGKPARTWPIQFLVRRTAHHVMDHAWEMEDRDLASSRPLGG